MLPAAMAHGVKICPETSFFTVATECSGVPVLEARMEGHIAVVLNAPMAPLWKWIHLFVRKKSIRRRRTSLAMKTQNREPRHGHVKFSSPTG